MVLSCSLAFAICSCATNRALAAKDAAPASKSEASARKPSSGAVIEQGGFRFELSADEVINGGLLLASVETPEGVSGDSLKGSFGDTEFAFYPTSEPRRFEALVGVAFQQKPGAATVSVRSGDGPAAPRLSLTIKVAEGDYVSEVLKVEPKFTNPSKKMLARIQKEQAEIGKIYRELTRRKYWGGDFKLPVDSVFTSRFGNRRMFNGEMKSFHQGADLRAPTGTPIHAPAAGRVALAKDLFFTGNTVILDHGYGLFTIYAHMSKLSVRQGAEVAAGQVMGLSGATGRAAGPHLHWGAVVHRAKIDPTLLTRLPSR